MRTQQQPRTEVGSRPAERRATPHLTPRRYSLRRAATVGVIVALLVATAVLSYLLGTQAGSTAAPQPATATPASAAVPEAPPAAPATLPVEDVPVLVDQADLPLPSALASVVRQVYDALALNDLDTVRLAYSAGGSDDWHTSSSHLQEPAVRAILLDALRTAPRHDQDGYTYAGDAHSLTFAESPQRSTSGLVVIDGPWNAPLAESASTNSRPSTTDQSVTTPACASGTDPVPTGGYSCTDTATGEGVGYDGTVGVHGLRPCPPGTEVPTDPDEPTRDSSTGEICALY